jgi:phage repressor protein C with HTH and peptisase S24 domain
MNENELLRSHAPDTTALRFFPMRGDSMEPRIRSRDLVAVLPIDRVGSDNLYVLEILGQPTVLRVSRTNDGFRAGPDNPRYSSGTYTREQIDAMVLGVVIGVFAWVNDPSDYLAGRAIDGRAAS